MAKSRRAMPLDLFNNYNVTDLHIRFRWLLRGMCYIVCYTIHGEVKYFNLIPLKFLSRIKFRSKEDTTVIRYSPKKLFGFKAGEKRFEYVDYPYEYDRKRGYMEILVDGYLRLYTVDLAQITPPGYKSLD